MKLLAATLAFAAALAFTAITGTAHAASQSDVAEVAAMVTDTTVPVLVRHSLFVNGEFEGTEIVFIQDGMRYTLYNSGQRISPRDPNSAWLAVWMRPEGTQGVASLVTFSDSAFDGDVDEGVIGRGGRVYYSSDVDPNIAAQGAQYRADYQRRYDEAIAAALRYKRDHEH